MKKIWKWITLSVLSMLTCAILFACTPSNLDKAESKMEDAGYKVTELSANADEGIVGGINATKANVDLANLNFEAETIFAYLFESKKDAEAYANKVRENWSEDSALVQDGKWVYWGTSKAVEDFTK